MGFFSNMIHGNPNKRDFTEADLPSTRRRLFWDVLKVRFWSLFGVNLLNLIFLLPAAAWTLLSLTAVLQLNPGDPAAGAQILPLIGNWLVLLFPLIAISGPFEMGIALVLRNWARDEHSFVLSDFWDAVKGNWKQGLIFGLICGFAPLALFVGVRCYMMLLESSPLFYLMAGILVFAALIWDLSKQILPTLIVTYELPFFGQMRNALLMVLAELPRALLLRLLTLVPPLLALIVSLLFPDAFAAATALILVLYSFILMAFNKLIGASFANFCCEKHLNPKIDGAGVNIGLRPERTNEE